MSADLVNRVEVLEKQIALLMRVFENIDNNNNNNNMLLREYQNNEIIVSFYACGKSPINNLSNFSFIKQGIIYDGITYYSTEHAFQAQKYIKEQRHRFSIDGDLGNIETGFLLVFGNDKCEKKKQFWMKKDNIGIIAKMATNPKIGKKLGLIRDNNFVSSDEFWINILTSKFNIPTFKNILLQTENNYLLEFDRNAERTNPLWSGIIKNNKLYGNNLMGQYLMFVRTIIK